jgi:hypothetical protein
MTLSSENAALDPAQTAAENTAARAIPHFDNPNPDLGTPTPTQDPPSDMAGDITPAERPLSPREQIAANHKAARAAAEAELGEPTHTEMGEFIPPFIAKQEADAAAAAEADKAKKPTNDNEPRIYTLKVRGNDIPVASRDELAKLAEVESDEAVDFTDAQLIKLAQKQIAASQLLDEAKQAKKIARTAPRADEGDTQPDPESADDDTLETNDNDPPQHQSKADRYKAAVEKVQFGDAEEAAQAFAVLVEEGVRETVREQQLERRVNNVHNIIRQATREFEAANADIVQDTDFSDILYNRSFVQELKKDLVRNGFPPENVDRAVGNDIRSAMDAYVTIAADGRVKVRAPHQMLAAAAQHVRTKFGRPNPNPTPAPSTIPTRAAPAPSPAQDRLNAKRGLTPQPSRASVPRTTTTPLHGQTPAARSNVVANMRKQRGQD